MKTFCFAVSGGNMGAHCSTKSSAFMTAATSVVYRKRGDVVVAADENNRESRAPTEAWAWVWMACCQEFLRLLRQFQTIASLSMQSSVTSFASQEMRP